MWWTDFIRVHCFITRNLKNLGILAKIFYCGATLICNLYSLNEFSSVSQLQYWFVLACVIVLTSVNGVIFLPVSIWQWPTAQTVCWLCPFFSEKNFEASSWALQLSYNLQIIKSTSISLYIVWWVYIRLKLRAVGMGYYLWYDSLLCVSQIFTMSLAVYKAW